jgi:hypothetical protein
MISNPQLIPTRATRTQALSKTKSRIQPEVTLVSRLKPWLVEGSCSPKITPTIHSVFDKKHQSVAKIPTE